MLASAALVATLALAGCNGDSGTSMMPGRALAPLSEKMVTDLESKNMDKSSPILVRSFKTEAELEVWKQDRTGQFALLKTYPICRWSGDLGPKIKEGDRQAPEGFYTITPAQMNPNSSFYLAFNMGYPNAFDKSLGRTGANLMIHGDCSSRGCYAMTDEQISEIYSLGRESFFGGQRAFQVQAYPFRMTPENMAKHRNSPHYAFWKMIKQGNDHFEVTRQEPKVSVCERRYVFDAASPDGTDKPLNFNASAKCPIYEVPRDIADAVNDKKRQDEYKTAQLISQGTPAAVSRAGVDGGMNPVFASRLDGTNMVPLDNEGRANLFASAAPGLTSRVGIVPPAPLPAEAPAVQTEPQRPTALARAPIPKPAPQPKDNTAAPEPETNFASALTNLFRTASAEPKPTDIENAPLRGSDNGQTKSAAKPRPASVVAQQQPKRAPQAANQVASSEPAPATSPAAPTITTPRVASAFAAPPASNSMSGAQAVVPAGSFNSRWSGL